MTKHGDLDVLCQESQDRAEILITPGDTIHVCLSYYSSGIITT